MSTTAEPQTRYTPDDLLAHPDRNRYELVDGHLVERNVSALSSLVASKLNRLLGDYCEPGNIAWIFAADCGYRCFPGHPDRVRKPDVSAVLRDRLPVEQLDEGYITIAPDLAVEVISPNDLAYEVEKKVREYLEAGVRLVWVVYPPTRLVRIHRADQTVAELRESDELSGEDVIPGFRCRVGDLFPPEPAAPTTNA